VLAHVAVTLKLLLGNLMTL